nr:protein brambleberry-like isoform X1 [Anser cygnoides]
MDPDTQSAYRVISNRVCAVCNTARHLEFRHCAVAAAAFDRLDATRALKEGREELRERTAEGLRRALSGRRALEEQQERLAGQQGRLEASIRRAVRQRALEERLVDGGRRRAARLVEGVARSVGNVSGSLAAQDEGLRDGQRAILADLRRAQERARDVSAQLESHLASLLAQRSRVARYLEEVAGTLQRLNRSLGLVLAAAEGVRSVQSGVEGHLRRFRAALAWAGLSPGAVPTCVLHGSSFLLLALLLAFLQAPVPPRALLILLLLVGSSVLGELRGAGPIGFPALTALLGLAVAGHWVLAAARRIARLLLHQAEPRRHLTSTPERGCKMGLLREELDGMELSCLQAVPGARHPPDAVPCRALVPGAAPGDGRGPPRREDIAGPRQLEDKAELGRSACAPRPQEVLVRGDAGTRSRSWAALGAQTPQPVPVPGQQQRVLAVPAVPVPGAHQGWAAVSEASCPWAGLLPPPRRRVPTPLTPFFPLPAGRFLTQFWLFLMRVENTELRSAPCGCPRVGMGLPGSPRRVPSCSHSSPVGWTLLVPPVLCHLHTF